jgi:hypothetical protein
MLVKIEFHDSSCHCLFNINTQYTFTNLSNPSDTMTAIFSGLSRIDGYPIFDIISHSNPIQTYTYNNFTIKYVDLIKSIPIHFGIPSTYEQNKDRLLSYVLIKFDITHEDLSDDSKFNQKLRETILKDILT